METPLDEVVTIYPDAAQLALAAAELVATVADEAISRTGRCAVALSGGTTPRTLFRLLGKEYGDRVGWRQVHLFWVDERAVPPDDNESNFHLVREELIDRIAIPSGNIHRMEGELPSKEAAARYEKELQGFFGENFLPVFNLILLGVGEDGHTASLFPGSTILGERVHLVAAVQHPVTAAWRITLTLPVLNNANKIIFLVSGSAKAPIMSTILGAGKRADYPAGLVSPVNGHLIWLLDQQAASDLPPVHSWSFSCDTENVAE